ncbi:MAG: TraB/GumN family protein [Bacteroidetes bacterium]|nr:TraB/GumN family protein [Bacteroidota bacterium]
MSFSVSAQYHSLCWRITGSGLKQPSYLYGTMHVSDRRVFNFGDKVMKAFDASKAYAMELDPDKMFNPAVALSLIMKDGSRISQMLPDSDYRFADSVVRSTTGIGLAPLDRVEPVLITAMLEEGSMGVASTDTGNMSEEMDLYFYRKAKSQKKKQIGIETVDEQIAALHTLSYQEQADQLRDAIEQMRHPEGATDKDLLKYYIDQDLDSLLSMSDDAKMPDKFYKALVTDRNIRMADRIAEFVRKQPTFIAIGALHLPGQGGVIELLRRKGYKVEEWK